MKRLQYRAELRVLSGESRSAPTEGPTLRHYEPCGLSRSGVLWPSPSLRSSQCNSNITIQNTLDVGGGSWVLQPKALSESIHIGAAPWGANPLQVHSAQRSRYPPRKVKPNLAVGNPPAKPLLSMSAETRPCPRGSQPVRLLWNTRIEKLPVLVDSWHPTSI